MKRSAVNLIRSAGLRLSFGRAYSTSSARFFRETVSRNRDDACRDPAASAHNARRSQARKLMTSND